MLPTIFLFVIPVVAALADFTISRLGAKIPHGEEVQRSLLLGLVVLCVGMIWEFRGDIVERLDSPALEVVRVPRLRPVAQNMLETDKKIGQNSYLNRYFENELNQFNKEVTAIGEGRFELQAEDLDQFIVGALSSAKTSIVATSYVIPGDWWNTTWGKQYQRVNFDAVSRGVRIKRVFIYSSISELREICGLIREEQEHGIDVKIVDRALLKQSTPPDLIVIDDALAGNLTLSEKRAAGGASFYTDNFSIEKARHEFENMYLHSQDFQSCPAK